MKTQNHRSWIYWLVALVVLLPITFFAGYRYATLSYFIPGNKIDEKEAQKFRNQYTESAKPQNDIIEGWEINRQQYEDMRSLVDQVPELTSFRIYEGINDNKDTVRIMYGIKNHEPAQALIYMTTNKQSGLCPPFCDIARGQ